MSAPPLVPPAKAVADPPLWWALRGDLQLAGSSYPAAGFPFAELATEHALSHVVALTGGSGYDAAPLVVSTFRLTDLVGGLVPPDPDRELAAVTDAAREVRALLDERAGVLVHCLGGTGRTGTVIGAVLVSLGHPVDDVASWLDAVHRRRGHGAGWPESPWQRSALTALGR